jgi:hypothetical protein
VPVFGLDLHPAAGEIAELEHGRIGQPMEGGGAPPPCRSASRRRRRIGSPRVRNRSATTSMACGVSFDVAMPSIHYSSIEK